MDNNIKLIFTLLKLITLLLLHFKYYRLFRLDKLSYKLFKYKLTLLINDWPGIYNAYYEL